MNMWVSKKRNFVLALGGILVACAFAFYAVTTLATRMFPGWRDKIYVAYSSDGSDSLIVEHHYMAYDVSEPQRILIHAAGARSATEREHRAGIPDGSPVLVFNTHGDFFFRSSGDTLHTYSREYATGECESNLPLFVCQHIVSNPESQQLRELSDEQIHRMHLR